MGRAQALRFTQYCHLPLKSNGGTAVYPRDPRWWATERQEVNEDFIVVLTLREARQAFPSKCSFPPLQCSGPRVLGIGPFQPLRLLWSNAMQRSNRSAACASEAIPSVKSTFLFLRCTNPLFRRKKLHFSSLGPTHRHSRKSPLLSLSLFKAVQGWDPAPQTDCEPLLRHIKCRPHHISQYMRFAQQGTKEPARHLTPKLRQKISRKQSVAPSTPTRR